MRGSGTRRGIARSAVPDAHFSHYVQDKLERIDSPVWRRMLFTLCFMHSVTLERRKFDSLGWNQVWEEVGWLFYLFFISVTTACAKRTGAAASVERRRREPARAISPE